METTTKTIRVYTERNAEDRTFHIVFNSLNLKEVAIDPDPQELDYEEGFYFTIVRGDDVCKYKIVPLEVKEDPGDWIAEILGKKE